MCLQGAYGILCEVESHPFPTDAMLFMDWRDEHTSSNPEMQQSNRCMPAALLNSMLSDLARVLKLDETRNQGLSHIVCERPFMYRSCHQERDVGYQDTCCSCCAQAMTVVLQQAADVPLCHAFLRHEALPGGDVSGCAASCAF